MKRNDANQSGNSEPGMAIFKNSCRASCRKILARFTAAREMIFNQSRQALKVHERLLRLALNEAEAVAWQTVYPHLIFPALATEKIQAVIAWDAKRRALQRARPAF